MRYKDGQVYYCRKFYDFLLTVVSTSFNPLPTKVANMQLLDPLCFVCTLEQNRVTQGDVPRRDKHVFSQKSVSVFAPPPQTIHKVGTKVAPTFLFFPIFVIFYDFLTPCDLLGVVWKTPWGLSLPKIRQVLA